MERRGPEEAGAGAGPGDLERLATSRELSFWSPCVVRIAEAQGIFEEARPRGKTSRLQFCASVP